MYNAADVLRVIMQAFLTLQMMVSGSSHKHPPATSAIASRLQIHDFRASAIAATPSARSVASIAKLDSSPVGGDSPPFLRVAAHHSAMCSTESRCLRVSLSRSASSEGSFRLNTATPASPAEAFIKLGSLLRSSYFASPPVQEAAPNANIVGRSRADPNYLAVIELDRATVEERCLDEAVYFESRGESEAGQAAVAQVVLNRVQSGRYPASICGVVYQNQHRHNACQFSFACKGRALRVAEPISWKTAVRIAHEALVGGGYSAEVGGSTHYFADYVHPRWARALKKMDVIGHHIFFRSATAQETRGVRDKSERTPPKRQRLSISGDEQPTHAP
jgi:spore germination cell wall hydrolase CwlJ-like protein